MTNLSILLPTFFLFLLLQHNANCAQTYTPPDTIAVDCGSSASGTLTAQDGRTWTGDKNSKFVAVIEEQSSISVSATALTQSSSNGVPYLTARISKSQFSYMFSLNSSGPKFIRLHFYPAQYDQGFDRSESFFSVKVGPFTLLNNFSASLTADHLQQSSLIKEFCVNLEQNQSLTVTFTPSTNTSFAFINGIELVSMPTSLYYSRSDDQGLPFIGQNTGFQIDNYTALESIHRLNVGGRSIPPMGDTGMYRNWYDDSFYLVAAGVVPSNTTIKLNYSMIPEYTAPDDVYRTARSMGSNRTENLLYNLTWRLPVDSGFRRFRIYLDNKTAETAFDVIEEAGGKGTPIYKDYVIMVGNFGDKSQHTLFIALHPKNIYSAYADALLNGVEVFKLNNSDGNLGGPNPLPEPSAPDDEPSSQKADKSNTKRKLLLSSCGGGIVLLILLTFLCYIIIWRQRKRQQYGSNNKLSRFCCWMDLLNKGKSSGAKSSSLPDQLYRHFSLDEIKAGTRDFDESLIIGVGGFGNVYKGFLDDGQTIVAIKRLNPESKQGAREFITEIGMLSQLRHVHLVSLIGYCNDNNEMILVYDYMMNGTLCHHLYDTKNDPLTWKQRLKICHGAAIGLNYLHTEVKYTVIHRDVTTSNILLDDKFTAKVSDFGLSKMYHKIDIVNTGVKGTWGYLDPEYARGHALTEKSDVYSFGVVLFEVLCARKALDKRLPLDQMNLAHWVKKCIANGTLYQVIDPQLKGKIAPECFKVFVEIAECCIRGEGVNRPLMNDVMERLGFALELQETADAELEKNNHGGTDYCYPDIVFPVAPDIAVDSKSKLGSNSLNSSVISGGDPLHGSSGVMSSKTFLSTTI